MPQTNRLFLPLLAAIAAGAAAREAAAQLPTLRTPAAIGLGATNALSSYTLTALPGSAYAVFVDVTNGPVRVLGQRFQLGFSPALVTLDTAMSIGVNMREFQVPASLPIGAPIYLQAVVVDPAAPNGLFRASNGESLIPFDGSNQAIVERFDMPSSGGFSGNFDSSVSGRLQGGAVRRRIHQTVVPGAVPFRSPIQNPLNPSGARTQMVFRDVDLGATGEVESVVAVRWAVVRSRSVIADQFSQIEIRLGATDVEPDYSVSTFSALPLFPNSGLDQVFANNIRATEPLEVAYSGPYAIQPGDVIVREDKRYMPYPQIQPVRYAGTGSLLVELSVPPQSASGFNGQSVQLAVQSSPLPGARAVAAGRPGAPLQPGTATTATIIDNSVYDYEFEFVRTQTEATSRWIFAQVGADYSDPHVAVSQPAGTTVEIFYRGADDQMGAGATPWFTDIDQIDGKSFVQYRAVFDANMVTSEVPAIDTLVIPHR